MSFNLFNGYFQLGYVVRDAPAAMAAMQNGLGIANWHVMDVRSTGSPSNTIALAYVGDMMIELIEANPEIESIYSGHIPDDPEAAKLHHLGFLVHNDADWAIGIAAFERAGYAPAFVGSAGDLLDFHYGDARNDLGHFVELIHLKPAGADFFAPVPRN